MSADVIDLSDYKVKREEKRFEEIVAENDTLEDSINIISTTSAMDIATMLEEYGYNVTDNARAHDLMMVIESVRALAFRSAGKRYPLHEISEKMFEFEDEDEFKYGLLEGDEE
jgi:formate-dependent phosphoribosylglycinamide formyltransferase (GAR transformylase)